MKRILLLFLLLPLTLSLLAQNLLDGKKEKALSIEVTAGFNHLYSNDKIISRWAFSDNAIPLSPYQTFLVGIMLNPQLQTERGNKFDISLGINYGKININQEQQTIDKKIDAKIKSEYAFIRPELLTRYFLLKNKFLLPYISAGFGFNFTVNNNPTFAVTYNFPNTFDFIKNQSFKIRTVSMNPKIGMGFTYKRSRLDFSYAFPSDISNNATFKIRTGYIGLNYFFRVVSF
jgi:hypothetical protein